MKNRYLKNLNKLEFVVTNACTGRCKHCSEGDHSACGESIDPAVAAETVRRVAAVYDLQTVMTFGGEPLLCPKAVFAIQSVARDAKIPRRQVITNGYFAKNAERMREVVAGLAACGVNDLLLSVDAFHQESIPIDAVMAFAREALACGIPMRLQPAWLVSATDNNPYNQKTREILAAFAALAIPIGNGNVIFPEGNARRYLAEYFSDAIPENPYVEDRFDLRCISVFPNGDTLGGNLYQSGIMELISAYEPKEGEF